MCRLLLFIFRNPISINKLTTLLSPFEVFQISRKFIGSTIVIRKLIRKCSRGRRERFERLNHMLYKNNGSVHKSQLLTVDCTLFFWNPGTFINNHKFINCTSVPIHHPTGKLRYTLQQPRQHKMCALSFESIFFFCILLILVRNSKKVKIFYMKLFLFW